LFFWVRRVQENQNLSKPPVHFHQSSQLAMNSRLAIANWWFFQKLVAVDTSGRYCLRPSDESRAEWQALLGLLRDHGDQARIKGAVVTVAADALTGRSLDQITEEAIDVRDRLNSIVECLGVQIPVYLLITKCDVIPGFTEAYQVGFDYWVDVIDLPAAKTSQVQRLEQRLGRPLTSFEISVLQAAIIEMALLNCTHVLAVMTSRTAGSQWVPYEYGRVDRTRATRDAATSWCDTSSIKVSDLPDYLNLAPIHITKAERYKWLNDELQGYPTCSGRNQTPWPGDEPEELPTDKPVTANAS
jgi:hypothetical protein